jgi:hypothetical protein
MTHASIPKPPPETITCCTAFKCYVKLYGREISRIWDAIHAIY